MGSQLRPAVWLMRSRVSTVMLTRAIDIITISLSVCSSVCLSRSGIVSKRLDISPYFTKLMVAQYFTKTFGGAENDGHEIAGHEIGGPSSRA